MCVRGLPAAYELGCRPRIVMTVVAGAILSSDSTPSCGWSTRAWRVGYHACLSPERGEKSRKVYLFLSV